MSGREPRGVYLPGKATPVLRSLLNQGPLTPAAMRSAVLRLRNNGHGDVAAALASWWTDLVDSAAETRTWLALPQTASAEVDLVADQEELPQEITTREAAMITGTTERWVRGLVQTGRITGRKVGSSWLIDEQSLRDHLGRRESAA